ncbi:MAG: outer membrane beta-barrel protein [Bryobacteraceae bacterium]
MKTLGAVLILLTYVTPAAAQQWEIGGGAGYGVYRSVSVYAPAGKAAAGVRNRFVATAVFGEDLYRHVSGEFRYTYQDGDPYLEAGGSKANVQGQSHAFHYDLLVHARARGERVRPYVAAGIGAKLYRVTGPENPNQALGAIARLTEQDEMKALVTAGGGVKLRLGRRAALRLDFRDYITPFPKNIIRPAPLGTARGIFQQFTAMAGVSMLL